MERRRAHSRRTRSLHLQHLATIGLVASHEIEAESNGSVRLLCAFTVSRQDHYSLQIRSNPSAPLINIFHSVIVPIGLRLEYIQHATLSSHSIYTSIAVTITTTITTHLAVMSSTLPCLKQFLAMFESGMIGEISDAAYTGSGKGTRTDNSIALNSLTSAMDSARGRRRRTSDELELRPDCSGGDSRAEVSADGISTISNRSDAAIIKKTQRWEISYDRW
jgi:hypothetical protein